MSLVETMEPSANGAQAPIDRLRPGSDLHRDVLEKLRQRQRESAGKMRQFYERWRAAELRYQAYMTTKEFDELRKAANKSGKAPEFTTVTVPYTYATVQTIITYLVHTFCGNRPMFQVGANSGTSVPGAQNMETLLQYNMDHVRAIMRMYQFFHDGETYGLQAMRCAWRVDSVRKTVWGQGPMGGPLAPGSTIGPIASKQDHVSFEGNDLQNIDPFCFYPDPSVPMTEVSRKGEYVFWSDTAHRNQLKKAEAAGQLKWVDNIPDSGSADRRFSEDSQRGRLAEADSVAGRGMGMLSRNDRHVYDLFQGTVELIPSEWGLGDEDYPEKWLFTWANDQTIIQATPLDSDHDQHPVIVGEPYSTGYAFGNLAVSDMVAPLQDTLSWLINSHVHNVRAVLNNELVVNPLMVDIKDLQQRGPGRMIKMLPAAFGQNPQLAVQQLQVQDVTQSHLADMATIQRIADQVSAINDNLRGVQQSGGRKTATEVRTSGESGASRLASHAMLISSQSLTPLASMMSSNYQQYLSQEFQLQVTGAESVSITPQTIAGDFTFPINDGTLPTDKYALVMVWKEILVAMAQNPMLGSRYDIGQVFEYTAKLGGAKNLPQFRLRMGSPEAIAQQAALGNMVPAGARQ